MLAEERFALILDLLARQRTATVQELCEALNASESTIRRDLNELDKQGKLNKVHGGATLVEYPYNFIHNPNIDLEQPDKFGDVEYWWDIESYIGATLFEKD